MMHDEFSRARTLERMANDLITAAKHNALMPLSDNAVAASMSHTVVEGVDTDSRYRR
jgi:hypothetical protein